MVRSPHGDKEKWKTALPQVVPSRWWRSVERGRSVEEVEVAGDSHEVTTAAYVTPAAERGLLLQKVQRSQFTTTNWDGLGKLPGFASFCSRTSITRGM